MQGPRHALVLPMLPSLVKFGGWHEWHCRMVRKELRRSALIGEAQPAGVALFRSYCGETNPGIILRIPESCSWLKTFPGLPSRVRRDLP